MNFASVPELALYTGRTLADDDNAALLALNLASGLIRAETGSQISRTTETIEIDGEGRNAVLLPNGHYPNVTDVTIDGNEIAADQYSVNPIGMLTRHTGVWPSANFTVTYSHGYDEIPGTVKLIALAAAARILSTYPSGIKSESVGSYSVTYTAESPTLLANEIRALDPFRNVGAY